MNSDTGYATLGHQMVDMPSKPLESLALAAQRINNATVNIGFFLDRWHGSKPEPVTTSNGQIEPSLPHSGNLDRIFSALDRLEQRIDALGQIG